MNRKTTLRTLSMLLVSAMLLPLVGCAGNPLPTEPDTPQPVTATAPTGAVAEQLAAAVYPTQPLEELPALPAQTGAFWQTSMTQFLTGADRENRVFSPLNVYLALAMLAETTDGDSRGQLLSLLGADSLETLRTQAQTLWRACYVDDGTAKILPACSLWARNDLPYHTQTLQNLAEFYYADAFSGRMGSPELNAALQSWINAHTGDLLADQVGGMEMNVDTVLSLVTTLYYKAPWQKQFLTEATVTDNFTTPDGSLECEFLCESEAKPYYVGRQFTAVGKPLAGGSTMVFLLPNEGVAPEQLLSDPQALAFLSGELDAVDSSRCLVHLRLPKFDAASQLSLIDGLKALGVTDVFDETRADFSPLTDALRELFVSQADHGARVMVDEQGCEAAAYTMISIETKSARPVRNEVEFTLDRPFLFGVVTDDGLPLFTGVVNRPGSGNGA